MAKKEYDSFIDNPEGLADGEMKLAVRELTPDDHRKKYLTRYVKAQISRDPAKMPMGMCYGYGGSGDGDTPSPLP